MAGQLLHGGRLNAAARRWDIPVAEWLDLSTGINPNGWPVPLVPARLWQRLPEADDGLCEIIRRWAGVPPGADVLPVAGSQAAIQALPRLRTIGRVAVPAIAYAEHRHCWAAAGHEIVAFSSDSLEGMLDQLDVVIWIQPNNPTGEAIPRERLLEWHQRLAQRGGWLVVDEAFITGSGAESLADDSYLEGLIVLRSIGKFFGLAGIRAGAVLAQAELCRRLDEVLGPWTLGGATRYIMARALEDQDWQQRTERSLQASSERLHALLHHHGLAPDGGAQLFKYVLHERASLIAEALASQGILVRTFDQPSALRLGLPAHESEWQRLANALGQPQVQQLVSDFDAQI